MQMNTHMCIYVYTPFPSQQYVVCFPNATNILMGTVGAVEQEVQPQIDYWWQLVEGHEHLAGFLHINCLLATDFRTWSSGTFIKYLQRRSWELDSIVLLDGKAYQLCKCTILLQSISFFSLLLIPHLSTGANHLFFKLPSWLPNPN